MNWRAGAAAAEAAGMEDGGSGAAGGGLPLEERRDRAADPACADASHAGAGPGPASPGRSINPGHHSSPQGLRPGGPRTAEVEEAHMARWGFGQERRDVLGSALIRQWARTRMKTRNITTLTNYS